MPKILEHTHTYIRWRKWAGEQYYKCNDPLCEKSIAASMLVGKLTKCAVCGISEFVFEKKDAKLAKPRCPECSTTKAARQRKEVRSLIDSLFEEQNRIEKQEEPEQNETTNTERS